MWKDALRLLRMTVAKWWFNNSTVPPEFTGRASAVRKSFTFLPICLFIAVWTCGVFFHSVRHSSLLSYRYLLCSHYPRSGRWEPMQAVSSLPFVLSPSFFELFLTFWHQRMFLTHLQLPYLSPGTDRFSKEPWLFFTGEAKAFRNQDLGTRCAHCCWGVIASRPLSGWG